MSNRSDNFNRNDSALTLGSPSDGGSAWIALSGTWGISTNTGYNVSAGPQQIAVLDCASSVVAVTVLLSTVGNDNGLVVRVSDSSNYILGFIDGVNGAQIFRNDAGSFTQLAFDAGTTVANGDTIGLSVNASNVIILSKNGTTVLTVTDSKNSTSTQHGLRCHNNGTPRFDNFSITDNNVVPTAQLTPAFTQASSSPGWYSSYV